MNNQQWTETAHRRWGRLQAPFCSGSHWLAHDHWTDAWQITLLPILGRSGCLESRWDVRCGGAGTSTELRYYRAEFVRPTQNIHANEKGAQSFAKLVNLPGM